MGLVKQRRDGEPLVLVCMVRLRLSGPVVEQLRVKMVRGADDVRVRAPKMWEGVEKTLATRSAPAACTLSVPDPDPVASLGTCNCLADFG